MGARPGAPTTESPCPWGKKGWPARAMKWKLPPVVGSHRHDFCPEGPCPRAWLQIEGHLQVALLSSRPWSGLIDFERFTVFHTSGSGGGHDF
jgi:hypothetical protein